MSLLLLLLPGCAGPSHERGRLKLFHHVAGRQCNHMPFSSSSTTTTPFFFLLLFSAHLFPSPVVLLSPALVCPSYSSLSLCVYHLPQWMEQVKGGQPGREREIQLCGNGKTNIGKKKIE